jgi:ribosomal protein L29
MAKEKLVDSLRQLGVDELKVRLVAARKNLFDMKMKKSELKDPLKLRWARRDVAKIMTIIKEKETSAARK